MKIKLKLCKCGKTFSKLNGNLELGLCDTCVSHETKESRERERKTPKIINPEKYADYLEVVLS